MPVRCGVCIGPQHDLQWPSNSPESDCRSGAFHPAEAHTLALGAQSYRLGHGPLERFRLPDRGPGPALHAHFKSLLDSAGVKLLRLPACSPNLNAFAERFVRSIKQECLRHIVPLGEGHLRRTIGDFMVHYHAERNHQGLGNIIPFLERARPVARGAIRRRERLGGLLNTMNESPRELGGSRIGTERDQARRENRPLRTSSRWARVICPNDRGLHGALSLRTESPRPR
jgi:Integrase core domain